MKPVKNFGSGKKSAFHEVKPDKEQHIEDTHADDNLNTESFKKLVEENLTASDTETDTDIRNLLIGTCEDTCEAK